MHTIPSVLSPKEVLHNFTKVVSASRYICSHGKCEGIAADIGTSIGVFLGVIWSAPHYFLKLASLFYQRVFLPVLREIGLWHVKKPLGFLWHRHGFDVGVEFDFSKSNFILCWSIFMSTVFGIFLCLLFSFVIFIISVLLALVTTLLTLGGIDRWERHFFFFMLILSLSTYGLLTIAILGVVLVTLYPIHLILDRLSTEFLRFDAWMNDVELKALAYDSNHPFARILTNEQQKKIIEINNHRATLSSEFKHSNKNINELQPCALKWGNAFHQFLANSFSSMNMDGKIAKAKELFIKFTKFKGRSVSDQGESDFFYQRKALQNAGLEEKYIPYVMRKTSEKTIDKITTDVLACATVLASLYESSPSQVYNMLQIVFSYLHPNFLSHQALGLMIRTAMNPSNREAHNQYRLSTEENQNAKLDDLNRNINIGELKKDPVFLDNLHELLEDWARKYVYRDCYPLYAFLHANKGYMENYHDKPARKYYLNNYKALIKNHIKNGYGTIEVVSPEHDYLPECELTLEQGFFGRPHVSIKTEVIESGLEPTVFLEYASFGYICVLHDNELALENIETVFNYYLCLHYLNLKSANDSGHIIHEENALPQINFSNQ